MPEDARLYGRSEAERFDLDLRQQEQREREARLSRFALGVDAGNDGDETVDVSRPADGSSLAVWRLQQDVERLAAFHRAVLSSRAWKLIQMARRPFGRAW